jgi:hypothetical protein
MCPKVEIQTESLVAKCTLKWFFASVDKLMALKFRIVQKSFVASIDRADILSLAVSH